MWALEEKPKFAVFELEKAGNSCKPDLDFPSIFEVSCFSVLFLTHNPLGGRFYRGCFL